MTQQRRLLLYGRHACHLCDVMQAELENCLRGSDVGLELRDVDARAEWRQSYGLRVPVLMSQQGELLAEFHLDQERLLNWLAASC